MVYDYRTCGNHEVSIVIRYSKAIVATVLVALSFALMGAGNLPASSPNTVTIFNPGDANYTGYAIAVEPSGQVWTMDGAGRSQSQLPSALTQAFFTDLAAAGPLAQLASRPCTSEHPNMGIYLVWKGQHSPNLQCSSDSRADRLLTDATTIAHALYVQAYRMRPVGDNAARLSGTAGGNQPSSGYANSGASYGNASSSSASYGSTSYAPSYAATSAGVYSAGGTGYSFGMGASPFVTFSSLPLSSSGLGFGNSSLSTVRFGGVPVSVSNQFSSKVGLGSSALSNGTFANGNSSFSNSGMLSGQPFTGQPGSSGPSSANQLSFH